MARPGAATTGARARRGHRSAPAALALGLALAGIGVAAPSAAASRKPVKATKAQIERTCARVADVLSDGPDPSVDPVGYALAQVRPLREIRTNDAALEQAVDKLAAAFELVYKTNDGKGTEAGVDRAGKSLDRICPGAF
ncbi:MAG TPA: hypothetical protein VMD59_12440 [Acidimicrobiales bacterium]|nr:hypothetical protein [Acidimicrobiales bacterium]